MPVPPVSDEADRPEQAEPEFRQVMSARMKEKGIRTSFSGSYETYELAPGDSSIPFCQDSIDAGRIWVSRKKGLSYEVRSIGVIQMLPWADNPAPESIPEDANEIVVSKKGRIVFSWKDDGSGDTTPLVIKVWK